MANYYVSPEELTKEANIYLSTVRKDEKGKYIFGSGTVTERFGEMILMIARNLANKANFNQYTWKEDMVMQGVHNTCRYLHNYRPEKGAVFSYITMICYNSFVAYIIKQKKHSVIKNTCYQHRDHFINSDSEMYAQQSVDYSMFANAPSADEVDDVETEDNHSCIY